MLVADDNMVTGAAVGATLPALRCLTRVSLARNRLEATHMVGVGAWTNPLLQSVNVSGNRLLQTLDFLVTPRERHW